MRKYAPFLAHQMARFGVLTVPQMLTLCQGRCRKSALYRLLSRFKRDGYVIRTSHPTEIQVAYSATRELYSLVYGEENRKRIRLNAREFDHAIECAQVMIELSRYGNVSGIATERELGSDEVIRFCHGRVPDGIIEVTRGDLSYELAVEVEHSAKSAQEVGSVLSHYRQTLLRNMPCVGVLIVAGTNAIFEKYQRAMVELPKEIEERILLVKPEGLNALNTEYFGHQAAGPGRALEKLRTDFHGRGKYMPMKTKDFSKVATLPRGAVSLGGSAMECEVSV